MAGGELCDACEKGGFGEGELADVLAEEDVRGRFHAMATFA